MEIHPDIFGYLGAFFLTLLTYSQVYTCYKNKSAEGISPLFIFFQIMASVSFLIYGILIVSLPMIVANSSSLFGSSLLGVFKCCYKKN